MIRLIRQRTIASFISLIGLIVLVFFLSRLTGDPTDLFLPIDATQEMRDQFRRLHGFDRPLIEQFGAYVWDLLHLDFGDSIRRAQPAIWVVLNAFVWTLQLALITMTLVTVCAVVVGSLAAFRAGGFFDRAASLVSLIGASAPDFWIATVAIVLSSVQPSGAPGYRHPALARFCTGFCPSPSCSSVPSVFSCRWCAARCSPPCPPLM